MYPPTYKAQRTSTYWKLFPWFDGYVSSQKNQMLSIFIPNDLVARYKDFLFLQEHNHFKLMR